MHAGVKLKTRKFFPKELKFSLPCAFAWERAGGCFSTRKYVVSLRKLTPVVEAAAAPARLLGRNRTTLAVCRCWLAGGSRVREKKKFDDVGGQCEAISDGWMDKSFLRS